MQKTKCFVTLFLFHCFIKHLPHLRPNQREESNILLYIIIFIIIPILYLSTTPPAYKNDLNETMKQKHLKHFVPY